MNSQLNLLVKDIESLSIDDNNLLSKAWKKSLLNIMTENDNNFNPLIKLMNYLIENKDLKNENAYHNQKHTAEAVLSASYLLKNELTGNSLTKNGPLLLFSMLFHDVGHNGKNNTFDSELELVAVNSMEQFISKNESLKNFWKKKLEKEYGTLDSFVLKSKEIILGTEFLNGPKNNALNYNERDILNQLKMLANEADVLPSCLSKLGPQRGLLLAQEQNNESLGSWNSRLYFLEKLVTYKSKASEKLEIQKHIDYQIEEIKQLNPLKLDKAVKHTSFSNIAEQIDKLVNSKELSQKLKEKIISQRIYLEKKIDSINFKFD